MPNVATTQNPVVPQPAHLVTEAVQQQVQATDRSLDLLIGLLLGQPAKGSAA